MKKLITTNNLLLLAIFCTPLYLIRVKLFGIPTNIFEVLGFIAIIASLLKNKNKFFEKLFSLPKMISTGCALVLIGIIISIFFNNNQLIGLGILKGWFLFPMLFAFSFYLNTKNESRLEDAFRSIYFSTVLVGIIGIIYKLLGIVTYDNRLHAFYLSPNHLAMFLAIGIILGAYFIASKKQPWLHMVAMIILLIPLYFTYSYGAWMTVFVSMLFIIFLLINSRKRKFLGSFLLICFFIIIFFTQLNTEKLSSITNFSSRSSLASRQTIWKVSEVLIKKQPIVGIGPGNFQSSYLAMQPVFEPFLEWAVPQPHNIFLAFWLQTGVVGLIGFIVLLFSVFHMLWKVFRNKKNTALAASVFAFFLYTILHGIIDTPYWKNDLSFLFWIFLSFTLILHENSKKSDSEI